MSLSTYWIEDNFSPLSVLSGFDVVIDFDLHELTGINRITQSEGLGSSHYRQLVIRQNWTDPDRETIDKLGSNRYA